MSEGSSSRTNVSPSWAMPTIGLLLAGGLIWGIAWLQARDYYDRAHVPTAYLAAAKRDAANECVKGPPAKVLDCLTAKLQIAYQTAHDEQDLIAQQRAAMSALIAALTGILTLGVSIVGIYFVKRTLDATLKAVADTSKATQAMERQNELVAIAQRPWVTLRPQILKVVVNGNRLSLLVTTRAENIGKSVAQNTRLWMKVVQGEDRLNAALREVPRQMGKKPDPAFPLVPGDAAQSWNHANWAINGMKIDPDLDRADIFILAVVEYDVPGDPVRKVTQQAFSLHEGDPLDPFEMQGISHPPRKDLAPDILGIHPWGASRAT